MSDALIYASVRAWSSRFSPWGLSASTRLKQCNGRLQETLKYRFPRTYPQRGKAKLPSALRSIHTPALSLCYSSIARLPKHIA